MSPWIIGFSVFIVYPMVSSLYFSFTHYDLLGSPQWVGFANYKYMFTEDILFWKAIKNTVWFIIVAVPLQITFAIATATLLTKPRKGIKVYRTVYFLPAIAPIVAGSLAFLFLFNPAYGPINQFLSGIGIGKPPTWFYSPGSSKWALVILALWGVGEAMIIFLAGLLDVPRHLYEAADIEGGTAWQKFRYVTLPMITPVIFFSLVIGVILAFQYFTQAYVASTTLGGQRSSLGAPQNSLLFYSIYLFQQGFSYFRMGYASALAWVLFIITMLCTLVLDQDVEPLGALPGWDVQVSIDRAGGPVRQRGGGSRASDPAGDEAPPSAAGVHRPHGVDRGRGDVPGPDDLHPRDLVHDPGTGADLVPDPAAVQPGQLPRRVP